MSINVGGCVDFHFLASAKRAAINMCVANGLTCVGQVGIDNPKSRSSGLAGNCMSKSDDIRSAISCQYFLMA